LKASVGKTYFADTKLFLTEPNTPATKYTFVRVINKHRACFIYRQIPQTFPERICAKFYAQVLGYLLQLTGTTFKTMGAIYRMVAQYKFKGRSGKSESPCSPCINNHTLSYLYTTGSNGYALSFNLHKTEPACPVSLFPLPDGTEIGDIDPAV
jgi:hypothetical protein